jgi:hypothetical protein
METAQEIAARFVSDSNRNDLELAILRYLEHHIQETITIEREACAKIAGDYAETIKTYPWGKTATDIADAIRARGRIAD